MKVEFHGDDISEETGDGHDNDEESDNEVFALGNVPADESEVIVTIPKFKDTWKPKKWHGFVVEEDDNDYYQMLYNNGEFYEDRDFGKIVLRPWMIFMDKNHFKDTLKDYAIQEGFAINVLATVNTRYTGTCYAENCG